MTNTEGEPVSWQKVKWMRYSLDDPAQILYKYTFRMTTSKS
jgi:hypothetical protein